MRCVATPKVALCKGRLLSRLTTVISWLSRDRAPAGGPVLEQEVVSILMSFYQFRDFHNKDKTVLQSSYFCNGKDVLYVETRYVGPVVARNGMFTGKIYFCIMSANPFCDSMRLRVHHSNNRSQLCSI